MAPESEDLWQALLRTGTDAATEDDYEHGYEREVRRDLRQYVSFWIANEMYGLPIDTIEEIARVFDTTPVPRTADFVVGIGNVRGTVIPIIDLPTRLKMSGSQRGRDTRILIVRHRGELHGVVVDSVAGVVPIPPEDMEDAPGGIGGTRSEYIAALARHQGQLIIILSLDTVLDPADFVLARGA